MRTVTSTASPDRTTGGTRSTAAVSASPAAISRRAARPFNASSESSGRIGSPGSGPSLKAIASRSIASSRAIGRDARGCLHVTLTVATATPRRTPRTDSTKRAGFPSRAVASGSATSPASAATFVVTCATSATHDRPSRCSTDARTASAGVTAVDAASVVAAISTMSEAPIVFMLSGEAVDLLQHLVSGANHLRARLIGALPENHVHHLLDHAHVGVFEEVLRDAAEAVDAGNAGRRVARSIADDE